MNFKDYINDAWKLHASEPETVMAGFKNNLNLITSDGDVLSLAGLVVHVSGEHLGKWSEGLEVLMDLKNNPHASDMNSLNRSMAVLNLGAHPEYSLASFNHSDQARIYAITSSALAAHNELTRAADYLKRAEDIALNHLSKEDPANKSLGITGWNLACGLEEKAELTAEEIQLMKQSAHISRKFWELAGNWKDVEQCEYRLANTYLKANEPKEALVHAEICVKIIEENNNDPYEVFYGNEAMALCQLALNDRAGFEKSKSKLIKAYAELSSEVQAKCQSTLEKIKSK